MHSIDAILLQLKRLVEKFSGCWTFSKSTWIILFAWDSRFYFIFNWLGITGRSNYLQLSRTDSSVNFFYINYFGDFIFLGVKFYWSQPDSQLLEGWNPKGDNGRYQRERSNSDQKNGCQRNLGGSQWYVLGNIIPSRCSAIRTCFSSHQATSIWNWN